MDKESYGYLWYKLNGRKNPTLIEVINGILDYHFDKIEFDLIDATKEELQTIKSNYKVTFDHILDLIHANN